MKTLQQEIQEQINDLQKSKYGRLSDKQIAALHLMERGGKQNPLNNIDKRKVVIQYDLNGNEIQRFPSLRQAAEFINRDKGALRANIKGLSKTCAGFVWKYEE